MHCSVINGLRELTHVTLYRLCNTGNARTAPGVLCGLKQGKQVQSTHTIYTAQQALTNNKRCGLYVLNGMKELTNRVLSGMSINSSTIAQATNQAHEELNKLEKSPSTPGLN